MKKFFFDRIFFEMECIKNCRLFVMCNIQRDYDIVKKITSQCIEIINEIFDKSSTT